MCYNTHIMNSTHTLLTVNQAAEILGVNYKKVRRWADSGLIPCKRTKGGHRRVDISSILNSKEDEGSEKDKIGHNSGAVEGAVVGYCMSNSYYTVTYADFRDAIQEQEEAILSAYPEAEIVVDSEASSGLTNKPKLLEILKLAIQEGHIHLVVCYPYIISRTELDFVKYLLQECCVNCDLEVLLDRDINSTREEIDKLEDLVQLLAGGRYSKKYRPCAKLGQLLQERLNEIQIL